MLVDSIESFDKMLDNPQKWLLHLQIAISPELGGGRMGYLRLTQDNHSKSFQHQSHLFHRIHADSQHSHHSIGHCRLHSYSALSFCRIFDANESTTLISKGYLTQAFYPDPFLRCVQVQNLRILAALGECGGAQSVSDN